MGFDFVVMAATGMQGRIVTRDLLENEYSSFAPEAIVPPAPFFKELKKRNMIIYENGKKIN